MPRDNTKCSFCGSKLRVRYEAKWCAACHETSFKRIAEDADKEESHFSTQPEDVDWEEWASQFGYQCDTCHGWVCRNHCDYHPGINKCTQCQIESAAMPPDA